MALSNTLFPHLLSLFLVLMMLATVRSEGDATSFHIDSFSSNTPGLTYERDAFVPSGSSYLSLIGIGSSGQPQYASVGRVLYSNPVNFWEPEGRQASFETTIKFLISRYKNTDPADGMTFFIVPVDSTKSSGGGGGSLGIFDAVEAGASIFAVEFDIHVNPEFDPSFRHIGININSKTSANYTRFEGVLGQFVTVRISYAAPSRTITVVATYGLETSTVSYVYNLKTLLPQQVQVGLSASTGPSRPAFFNVFTWDFTSIPVWADDSTYNEESVIRSYA